MYNNYHQQSVQPASYAPAQQRPFPRLRYLSDEAKASWAQVLSAHKCILVDTCGFMLYTPETINVVYSEVEQLLRQHRSYFVTCGETRLELEDKLRDSCSSDVANAALDWYHRLLRSSLLVEEDAFQYQRTVNDYADPSILLRLMMSLLLSGIQGKEPLALITRDNKLAKDAYLLNTLQTLRRNPDLQVPELKVYYVNKYGKIMPSQPDEIAFVQSHPPVQAYSQAPQSYAPQHTPRPYAQVPQHQPVWSPVQTYAAQRGGHPRSVPVGSAQPYAPAQQPAQRIQPAAPASCPADFGPAHLRNNFNP